MCELQVAAAKPLAVAGLVATTLAVAPAAQAAMELMTVAEVNPGKEPHYHGSLLVPWGPFTRHSRVSMPP